ncbi:MAG TPA: hypothetical protein VGT03_06950 [Candidatus Acidoferrales bacterium]|nr:hypothetical protein [Candidatus Acidoferrales bacterium]
MKKKIFGCLSIAAVGLWLMALPAAAQSSHGQGHPGGGASVAHEPMGMGRAMSGHAMNGHGNGSAMGPKAPGDLLSHNTQLSSKLAPLAGCTGTASAVSACMQSAVMGFKNLGQFVAAVHVSNNLDIPFAQLKCTELGGQFCTPPTNASGMSLGQAIHTIKPTLSSTDVENETSKASKQAHGDMPKS